MGAGADEAGAEVGAGSEEVGAGVEDGDVVVLPPPSDIHQPPLSGIQ